MKTIEASLFQVLGYFIHRIEIGNFVERIFLFMFLIKLTEGAFLIDEADDKVSFWSQNSKDL
ncbi:hypothetical protein GWO09_06235, partial [candidate division KSB1 bacterium]|nr:hypothetical protein [candidate division KSB1 bacterium]